MSAGRRSAYLDTYANIDKAGGAASNLAKNAEEFAFR
jgi:hypothetical protein